MSTNAKQYGKGDVVLVMFPQTSDDGQVSTKRRPAVVVSNETEDALSEDVMLVPLTSVTRRDHPDEKRIFVSMDTPEGQAAGLRLDCFIDCRIVARIPKELIAIRIGRFSESMIRSIEQAIDNTDSE